jgi:hypothetical protein
LAVVNGLLEWTSLEMKDSEPHHCKGRKGIRVI